jgi:hypothetical protein
MVTRQIRLSSQDQIRKKLKDFIGKKINIVLCNRTVLFGKLKHAGETDLTFENMRLEPFTIQLNDISEVYFDYKE